MRSSNPWFSALLMSLTLAGVLGVGCRPTPPPPPQEDAGEPPGGGGNDAGPPGGVDAGTPGEEDAGHPGGGTDAGTPGQGDAGHPGGGGDAGTPGQGDAGHPGGPDGGSVGVRFELHRSSNAPACAALGPGTVPEAQQLLHRRTPDSYTSCQGVQVTDLRGDVGQPCFSTIPERNWFDLTSRGSRVHGEINGGVVTPLEDGFVSSYTQFGSNITYVDFVWFSGPSWELTRLRPGRADVVWSVAGHAGVGALVLRDESGPSGASMEWYDSHGVSRDVKRTFFEAVFFKYAGVNARGRALIAYQPPRSGPITGQWIGPDAALIGAAFPAPDLAPFDPDRRVPFVEELIDGSFSLGRKSVVAEGQAPVAAPGWLTARPEPFAIVNGNRGYAFYKPLAEAPGQPCQPSVTLVAPDGTVCATFDVLQDGQACPAPVFIGIDGTLMHTVTLPSETPDPSEANLLSRWWPGLFR